MTCFLAWRTRLIRKIQCAFKEKHKAWKVPFLAFMPHQPSKITNKLSKFEPFYVKDKKDTTQDDKDILGTKGTKQGHSGQKRTIGAFEVFFFSFLEALSRVEPRIMLARPVSDFYPWKPASMDHYRYEWQTTDLRFIYISRRLACLVTLLKTLCWFSSWPNLSKWRVTSFLSFSPVLWSLSTSSKVQ